MATVTGICDMSERIRSRSERPRAARAGGARGGRPPGRRKFLHLRASKHDFLADLPCNDGGRSLPTSASFRSLSLLASSLQIVGGESLHTALKGRLPGLRTTFNDRSNLHIHTRTRRMMHIVLRHPTNCSFNGQETVSHFVLQGASGRRSTTPL